MKTRVYLDNCCFNRPFDDRENLIIRLEAEAKLHVHALHIACAIRAKCRYFLTTDKRILKKKIEGIVLLNPLDYVRRTEGGE